MTQYLGSCECGAAATVVASDGEAYCCAHCLLNPLGCRCKFGQLGVAETHEVLEERDGDEESRCEHGCFPDEDCADCTYVPDLPCGADL